MIDSERTEMLLGGEAVAKLARSHVAVFGLGGVGGHAVEALVRAGVGELTLVDGDIVVPSNLNRQIFATKSTIGMPKIRAAEQRIREIDENIRLNLVKAFVLPDNICELFDFGRFDYVIDAVDTVSAKIAIVEQCVKANVPVISAMGAGNKLDPTKFVVTDIYKTDTCPLAAVMRRELRKRGVPGLKVVYSREKAIKPAFQPDGERKNTPASCSFVPSACGLIITGEVVRDLCRDEIEKSIEERC